MSDIHTLAFDIGGTGLKAAILGPKGEMLTDRVRLPTPYPCPPDVMLNALAELAAQLPKFDRISAGFPGIVRDDRIITAPHFGDDAWHDFPFGEALTKRLGKPAHVLNDAEVQAFGAITGHGLEFVITLGTGLGTALFRNGDPMPHMEFAQWYVRKDRRFNDYVGNAALREVGVKKWGERVVKTIEMFHSLLYFDQLYIGGGNARKIPPEFVGTAKIVGNEMGLTGGIHLWDREPAPTPKRAATARPKAAPRKKAGVTAKA